MTCQRLGNRRGAAGATLLEILVAMLVIGLVATGIITALIFGRRVTWRSGSELSGAGLVTETAEALRGAIGGTMTNKLSLTPGIYSNATMQNSPAPNDAAHRLAALNPPADFQRFLTNNGTGPNLGDTNADGQPDHGDGRVVVVEDITADLDGDGQRGLDLNGDGTTDLRRVRVRVKFTSPTT